MQSTSRAGRLRPRQNPRPRATVHERWVFPPASGARGSRRVSLASPGDCCFLAFSQPETLFHWDSHDQCPRPRAGRLRCPEVTPTFSVKPQGLQTRCGFLSGVSRGHGPDVSFGVANPSFGLVTQPCRICERGTVPEEVEETVAREPALRHCPVLCRPTPSPPRCPLQEGRGVRPSCYLFSSKVPWFRRFPNVRCIFFIPQSPEDPSP